MSWLNAAETGENVNEKPESKILGLIKKYKLLISGAVLSVVIWWTALHYSSNEKIIDLH